MGFLNQSLAQVRDLFASMTPAARITAALLLGIIGVSLGYLFQDYAAGSKEFLLSGETITSGEADRMQAAIAQAGLKDFERQGNMILVPKGQKAEYLAAVADGGALPANLDTLLQDETANLGLFVDRKTRDDRMKATRERMLSMVIRKMDGIEDANVLFDMQESKGFGKSLVTAAVSLRPAAGEELTPRREKMIRAMVAGATAGLDPADVHILNLADGAQWESSEGISPDDYDDPYFQTRVTYERQVKTSIEDLLRRLIPGIRVQVTADLDDTLSAETRSITSAGEAQAIREETQNKTVVTTQIDDRGRPGLTANGPNRTPPEETVAKNEHNDTTDTRDAQNFVPTTEEVLRRAGLAPKLVRAAIAIPSEFIAKVWRERNPDAAPEDRPSNENMTQITGEYEDKIRKSVETLLPRPSSEDQPFPRVDVTVFQSLTPPPAVEPTMTAQAMAWGSENSGSLIMAGLALVSLVMLRGMVKSIPTPETNVVLSLGDGGAMGGGSIGYGDGADGLSDAAGGGGGLGGDYAGPVRAAPERRNKLKLKKGPSLKEDLTDMVRDDPDAAAAILRTWISAAS